ncbi:VWA domain-containing protein [bacterium]|nr:VWA domain-containing protein [bacterium]
MQVLSKSMLRLLSVMALIMILSISTALAQLNRPPVIMPVNPALEMTQYDVDVEVVNQVATVTIQQTFANRSHRPLEGTYFFPLPKGAGVTDFQMLADGKIMRGEILDKDAARKIYEDIVRKQLDPALLEYAGLNLFKARIFPIPANGQRQITLTYSTILPQDNGLVQFNHPLGGRIVGGRFRHSGKHRQIISPNITIELRSDIQINSIYSPSHRIEIGRKNSGRASVSYEGNGTGSKQSFILYYAVSQDELSVNIITHRLGGSDDGYFLMMVTPQHEKDNTPVTAKDILFVMDTSGSMEGEKIEQAKAALRYCINGLDRNDRFNVITFSSEVRQFRNKLVASKKFKQAALEYIDSIEASGGTRINDALITALGSSFDGNRAASIVFLTDGLPTVGERDPGRIVKNLEKANRSGVKIFTFGVGYDVNTFLLDKIAQCSRSVSDYIEPNENIEERIGSFYDKIRYPVLTNLSVDFGDMIPKDVYPVILPDLHKGDQLTILGRFSHSGRTRINIEGLSAGRAVRISHRLKINEVEDGNDFLPHVWATRKIGTLMDEIRLYGKNDEVEKEIVRLSKRYGVMSPLTSFLVTEDVQMVDRDLRRINNSGAALRGSALPKGSVMAFDGVKVFEAAMAQQPVSGVQAVKMSKNVREMKEAETVEMPDDVKRIGSRTFYLNDDMWVDSEYTDEKTIDIKYGSLAYREFALMSIDNARVLALGEKMIFKHAGRFVKISYSGRTEWNAGEMEKVFAEAFK